MVEKVTMTRLQNDIFFNENKLFLYDGYNEISGLKTMDIQTNSNMIIYKDGDL